MAISTNDQLVDAILNRSQLVQGTQTVAMSTALTSAFSYWTQVFSNVGGGITPPTGSGAACTRATQGALPFVAPTGGRTLYIGACSFVASTSGSFTVSDRLVHTSGLDGTLTSVQTVNTATLPARALSNNGLGCYIGVEVYSAGTAVATNLTVNYTNTAGAAKSQVMTSYFGNVGRLNILPYDMSGTADTGVQSVQSVQLAASLGTCNFGITILKPLICVPTGAAANVPSQQSLFDQGSSALSGTECLFFYVYTTGASTLNNFAIPFFEGLDGFRHTSKNGDWSRTSYSRIVRIRHGTAGIGVVDRPDVGDRN